MFSACKKDKDAALGVDTHSIVFFKHQTQRYFNIVNTGDKPLNYTLSVNTDHIGLDPVSGTLDFNETARIGVQIDMSNVPFGTHTAIIEVSSNGGTEQIQVIVQKPAPLPGKLAWDVDYLKMPASEDSAYVELQNVGESEIVFSLFSQQDYVAFSEASGRLLPNATRKIWIRADKTALEDGLHAADVVVRSDGGDANIKLDAPNSIGR